MARVVTAAVVIRSGRVLVTRRAPGQTHAGKWEFPGGKQEPGESEQACIQREMKEELGIEGSAAAHLADSPYAYEGGEILLRAYLFDWRSGRLCPTVHDRLAWALPDELPALDFTPADLPVAQKVKAYMEEKKHG